MRIINNVGDYTIPESAPVVDALTKLSCTKTKIAFLINKYGVVTGCFSDGDFRRWVVSTDKIDLSTPVKVMANCDFVSLPENADKRDIAAEFSEKIKILPLVDESGRLVAIALPEKEVFSVGRLNVSHESRVLIIAEIGNNHNGSLDEAKRLVDSAIASGADCVKFQMRDMATLYVNNGSSDDASADLGTQYVLDLLRRFELSESDFSTLFDYCKTRHVIAICTPFDKVSADRLEAFDVPAFKVASADLTNHELLQYLAKKGRPLLVSTGMSTEAEISSAVDLLNAENANFIFLHCNSTYPCPLENVNLNYLPRLRELTGNVVGYSGHERGVDVPIASVALGAKVIEKHFTLDKTQEGNDHKVSLLPEEFARMVEGIRSVEIALGASGARVITQGEMINRESLAKSVIAASDIKKGQIISDSMLKIRSPGKGLEPYYKRQLIGRVAQRDFAKNDFFYMSDIGEKKAGPRNYSFISKFGVPVRYHDIDNIVSKANFGFVEFHLSYKDLELDFEEYLSHDSYAMECLVHAPELFYGDHLLDLCARDSDYRMRSIDEMRKVVDTSRALKKKFENAKGDVLIVTNVGGFSSQGFQGEDEKARNLELLIDSLSHLDLTGVEIIPQTMPPFPWHFGGQQFHNLFVLPDEIEKFCRDSGVRICLDISHTALACNYHDLQLVDELKRLAPYTAHIHLADASGTGEEGLQIGEGEIDFAGVCEVIGSKMKDAYWLPEVWQGHKNGGEGFWEAFDRLEAYKGL